MKFWLSEDFRFIIFDHHFQHIAWKKSEDNILSFILVPGPPYILSSRVYMDQVDIDFERPCQPNGRIMRYKVVLSNAMTGDVIRTEYPVPERLKFSALAPDTSYVVKLFAETEMGYGQSADLPFKTYPFRERKYTNLIQRS